jgi:Carbohydrate family 9 binding domain-like
VKQNETVRKLYFNPTSVTLMLSKTINMNVPQIIHLFSFCVLLIVTPRLANTQTAEDTHLKESILKVKKTIDFTITGNGSAPQWSQTHWLNLSQSGGAASMYTTQFKILYSDTGIYCLFKCGDKKITATRNADFLDLYNEDVVEVFFHPDETQPVYFEYELSPLNYELPIIVPNFKGHFYGWRPWNYEGPRKTRHAVHVDKEGNSVSSWTAEFFIPYALLNPLPNTPPQKGTRWRANFYRIDYDNGPTEWSWQPTNTTFHEYEKFGGLEFE